MWFGFGLIYALREPKILQALQYCSSELFLNRTYLKWRTGYSYPQNVLRNLARQASITHYTLSLGEQSVSRIKYTLYKMSLKNVAIMKFPSDVDIVPSPGLAPPLASFLAGNTCSKWEKMEKLLYILSLSLSRNDTDEQICLHSLLCHQMCLCFAHLRNPRGGRPAPRQIPIGWACQEVVRKI